MFEYGNEKRDPLPIVIYCGAGACGLLRLLYPLQLTGYIAEAYILTCGIFVSIPFEFQKREVKEGWFWKVMLGAGALIHLPLMVALWFLDDRFPVLTWGFLPMFVVSVLIGVPEVVIFHLLVNRFRPT
jgi:hypothetical protein